MSSKTRTKYLSIWLGLTLIFTQVQIHAESIPINSAELVSSDAVIHSDKQTINSDSLSTSPVFLTENQVPKLSLRWGCGDCGQNEKVIPLIEETYAKIASAKGYFVSESEVADVVITEFRQRNPGLRVMFGVLAGRDVLATRTVFREKDFSADDYSANALSGMNSLCVSVTQKIFDQILSKIHDR